MQYLLLFVALLAPVIYAIDPRNVCIPERLEFNVFDTKSKVSMHWALDYNLGLLGGGNDDYMLVRDFKHHTDYTSTRNTDGTMSCTSSPQAATDAVERCLPANATYSAPGKFGWGSGALNVEFWEYPTALGDGAWGVQMVGGQAIPVFVINPAAPESMWIYNNVTVGVISNPLLFQVPDNCPPKALVVG